jgi:hypothetical protein
MTPLQQDDHPCGDCGQPTTPYRARTPADEPYEVIVRVEGAEWWKAVPDDPGVPAEGGWEYYRLTEEIWAEANDGVVGAHGLLCIGCVELRLGRRLTPADFTAPADSPHGSQANAPNWLSTDRLADRVGYLDERRRAQQLERATID